ncbi:hypothetical protein PINS_up011051 [Pythium insidiosum]|nr:hypothetical protein PINS_up011051 [Pythium insidiosum]
MRQSFLRAQQQQQQQQQQQSASVSRMTQEPASSSKSQTPSSPTSAAVMPAQGHVSRSSTSFVARSQGVIARLGTLFTRRSMSSTRPEEALESAPAIVPTATTAPSTRAVAPIDASAPLKPRRRTTKMHIAPQLEMLSPVAVQEPQQQQPQQLPTRKQGSLPSLAHEPHKIAELSGATTTTADPARRPPVRRVQVQPLAADAAKTSDTPSDEVAEESSSTPPFTWRYTLKHLSAELTEFEKLEVTRHQEVFFVSSAAVKRRRHRGKILPPEAVSADADASFTSSGSGSVELHNDGFDDDRGDYLMLAGDHLAYRYEVLHPLGAGSFGQVVACRDHKHQRVVAVKVIRNRKKYKEQALVEIQVLLHLRAPLARSALLTAAAVSSATGSPHVVELIEYFEFRHHLCLTFELLGVNLYDYLKLRFFQGMPTANLRVVATQLLVALASLRLRHVIHCDLKPENVLIRAPLPQFAAGPNGASAATAHEAVESICLVDFGSSCLTHATMYTYIQSRFYRSPEVILGHVYDMAIDMWSFGCILVELHTGHPIFAGENEREQLMCMLEVLGVPPTAFLLQCKRRKHFFEEQDDALEPSAPNETTNARRDGISFRPIPFTNSRGRKRLPGTRPLEHAIKSDDAAFVALVRKCFTWVPSERLTPEQALREPWITAQR